MAGNTHVKDAKGGKEEELGSGKVETWECQTVEAVKREGLSQGLKFFSGQA